MARLRDKADGMFADAAERWQQAAQNAMDAIAAAETGRLRGDWDSAPGRWPPVFLTDTTFLVGWLARKLPSLNPEPLQLFYDAARVWHDGERPVPYNQLDRLFEQALIVLGAAWDEIYGRAVHPPDADETKPAVMLANEARDKWLYEKCVKGETYKTILAALRKETKWEAIESVQGLKSAATRYAERHKRPAIPKRQQGKPARKAD